RCPHAVHSNAAWDRRAAASVCPQSEQRCEVHRGETIRSSRPASSALYASIRTSPPHPASWIDRLSPDLALAPFGSKPPTHRGRGAGRRTTRANRQVLDHDQVVVVDQLARELVGEVASLVAHPAMVLRCPILPTSSALGAPLLGRQVPLRSGEPSRGLSFQARTIDELSLGGGNQVHDP